MTTTQIELTDDEAQRLEALAARTGERPEEVARRAVADFLASHGPGDWRNALIAARGLWADRDDLPDLRELREESDSRVPGERE